MALQAGSKGVNPKDLTPLSNRVKDVGDMDAYLTKEEARRTYLTLIQSEEFLTKLVAQATYQTIANMINYQEKLIDGQTIKRLNGESLLGSGNISVLTQTIANTLYQSISGMSDYVKWEDLPDVPSLEDYVKKVDAVGYNDILTKTLAQSLYQTISGMSEYLKKTDAVGYNDILTKTLAQSLYQTISGMSDYLTKLDAQTLYQAILQSGVNIKTINNQSLLGSSDIAVQEPLVSGTNIKTINNQSLLGLGNMTLQKPLISGTNIKTINNESLLGSGNISISGGTDKPFTNTGVINIVSSTSTGSTPLWRNVNLNYHITADGTEFMITGQCECRGNGISSTTEITTDFVIPNITSAKTISGFPINFTGLQGVTTLEISDNGTVGIKLVNTTTNYNSLTFIPIRLKLADYA